MERPPCRGVRFARPAVRSSADRLGTRALGDGVLRAARAAVGVALLTLAACATTPEPEPVADPQRAWRDHQKRLAGVRDWSVTGRIAVAAEDEAWNASIQWHQSGESYRIRIAGPFGQGTMELSGRPGAVVMRTGEDEPARSAANPETLLLDTTGWRVPLSGMRYWMLGRSEPGTPVDAMELDVAGRLQRLEQSGWRIRFLRYEEVDSVPLPTKVFMEAPRLSARIVVNRWGLGA